MIFLVPALPVVLFYVLFDRQNYFDLENAAKGVVASGPIAAYVFLVYLAAHLFQRISGITEDVSPLQAKILGDWHFTATSFHGTARKGSCTFEVTRGQLCVSGSFMDGDKNVGNWRSTMARLSQQQLDFVYRLSDFRGGEPEESTGLISLHLDPADLSCMSGNWAVLGRAEAIGDVTLKRTIPTP